MVLHAQFERSRPHRLRHRRRDPARSRLPPPAQTRRGFDAYEIACHFGRTMSQPIHSLSANSQKKPLDPSNRARDLAGFFRRSIYPNCSPYAAYIRLIHRVWRKTKGRTERDFSPRRSALPVCSRSRRSSVANSSCSARSKTVEQKRPLDQRRDTRGQTDGAESRPGQPGTSNR